MDTTALPRFELSDYVDGIDLRGNLVTVDPPCKGGVVFTWKPGDPGKPYGYVKEVGPGYAIIEPMDWPLTS